MQLQHAGSMVGLVGLRVCIGAVEHRGHVLHMLCCRFHSIDHVGRRKTILASAATERVLACIRHHIGDIRRVLACISSGPVIEFSSLRSQLEFMPIYNSHRQCSLIPSKHVLLSYYFSTASSTLASSHGKELGRMVGLRVESGCLGLECQGGPQ